MYMTGGKGKIVYTKIGPVKSSCYIVRMQERRNIMKKKKTMRSITRKSEKQRDKKYVQKKLKILTFRFKSNVKILIILYVNLNTTCRKSSQLELEFTKTKY